MIEIQDCLDVDTSADGKLAAILGRQSGFPKEVVTKVAKILQHVASNGDEAVVAILKMSDSYQPQLWEFLADEMSQAEFTSGPTPIDVMDNLSGDNWVSSWYQLLDEELAIAMQLDEELEIPQRDLTNDEGSPQTGGGGGGSPNGPGRGRSPQRGTPIAPPSHDPSRPGG